MRWINGGTAAALALSGCAGYDSDLSLKLASEHAVRSALIDPHSAVFSDLIIHRGQTGQRNTQPVVVCGYVNSRNRMGGMSGKAKFVSHHTLIHEFESYSVGNVSIENPMERDETVFSDSRREMRTLFEKVYWDPHCEPSRAPADIKPLDQA
ncbi:hypothetical protein [Luteimonas fraxinea]|uniref:Lipoprotein n=1 Tax=Luteimonas fraxinea TaxID=2901869 RepID=A0ABS8UCD1_9GAMM|nr:hypothetical protein [Luteimonas fraxinea]MCD9096160.1 hypothetical protein [Luteimonas fraxinea]